MTAQEWLAIGYQTGVITFDFCEHTFQDVYRMWFQMKMRCIREQSLDRLECTYNRYIKGSRLEGELINQIGTLYIISFLNQTMIQAGKMSHKEYQRLLQIVNNPLVYALDLELSGAQVIDWKRVKRNLAIPGKSSTAATPEKAISPFVFCLLCKNIIQDKIYEEKQSACLCLLLNFYLGLRIGELASLQWSNINLVDKTIRVYSTEVKAYPRNEQGERAGRLKYTVEPHTKTCNSMRELPLITPAVQIVELLRIHHNKQGYQSDFLAYDGVEGGILSRSLARTLTRVCVLSGIPPFNSHRVRKTFASWLHDGGVPTRIISDLVGHADISTTEKIYILSYDDEIDRARSHMERVMDGLPVNVPGIL